VRTRFGLREKLILITAGIVLLAISINGYLNLKDVIRVYKESVIERVFAQSRELEVLIEEVTELGLDLGELKGLNEECRKWVEAVPYATYCFIMGNDGRVYYHNLPEKVGSIHTDAITQKALEAEEKIVQYFRLDSEERVYDFSVPIGEPNGKQLGLIRIGILSQIIDKEVSRLRNRAFGLGIFFILVAGTSVFFLTKFGILKPIRCLMDGIAKFGRGKLDSRIELKTGDEIEELANSFNHMAEDLQKTTVSRDILAREVTERKRAEKKLKDYSEHLTEMVEERTRELKDAQEDLIRNGKLSVLGQLAGGVGHELRNPLGVIKNAAYFLNMALEKPDPEVKETLEILEKEVATSERIIHSLLGFARPRSPTRRKMNLNLIVREALSRSVIPENVEVISRLDEALPVIIADPDQLGQVFANIILNAIQAMPEGGRLIVKSEIPGPGWEAVSFADTGAGILEENLGKLFEPLFTTKAKGIGLGLAVIKTLVEGHGGTIEVQSEVGKGSIFTVRLPIGGEQVPRKAEEEEE